MKTITKYLTFHTEERFKLINITPEIEKVVENPLLAKVFVWLIRCILHQAFLLMMMKWSASGFRKMA